MYFWFQLWFWFLELLALMLRDVLGRLTALQHILQHNSPQLCCGSWPILPVRKIVGIVNSQLRLKWKIQLNIALFLTNFLWSSLSSSEFDLILIFWRSLRLQFWLVYSDMFLVLSLKFRLWSLFLFLFLLF